METLFFPSSLVIIGVSGSPSNVARCIIDNLERFEFKGRLYLVGSKRESIGDRKIFTAVDLLPEVPDVAVILIPAGRVPQSLDECGRKGIKRIVIESGGLSEFGEERKALENEISLIADRWGMKIVGPNCVGVVNIANGLIMPFYALYPEETRKGSISVITQSGGLLHDILSLCHMANLGLNKLVSIGNKLLLDENDFLEYFIHDPSTECIGMYLEDIHNGRRFIELVSGTAKPVIILKSNRSVQSREIAKFHTSALAGDDRIVDEALRKAGAHRVDNLRQMVDAFKIFSLKLIKGSALSAITRSGGHAVMASDSVYRNGFRLSRFSDAFYETLSRQTRAGVIRRTNPIDLGDVFDLDIHMQIIKNTLDEKDVDAALAVHSYAIRPDGEPTKKLISSLASLSEKAEKPIVFCMTGHREDWFEMRAGTSMPIFMHVDEALSALNLSLKHSIRLSRSTEQRARKRKVLPGRFPAGIMAVDESFGIVKRYGISVPEYRIVNSAAEGVRAAREIGFPVAWKISSPNILHKTETGAVHTNIKDGQALRRIFYKEEGKQYLIQQMVSEGVEVIIGGRNDPEFGPLVLCGLGGVFVEIYKDTALRIAPVDETEAAGMIDELKAAPLLTGFRGGERFDIGCLRKTIVHVSRLLCEHPEIELLDINPFILQKRRQGGFAVDVKIKVKVI